MHYYATLFDSFYLSRGLIMYNSLKGCTREFHLFIFAFDDLAYDTLLSLRPENATIISLKEFETPELEKVRKERTKAEYCWTCTPSVISYVIDHFKVPDCTYVDSDLQFFSDPSDLISELDMHGKNVLITEHRFSFLPRLYEEKRGGRFCVQFMTFRNEPDSLKVLDIWRKQCLEWCYSRYEDGKFGDQKYLDEWPDKYENVHILQHQGGGLAPWNLQNYSFNDNSGSFFVTEKRTGIRSNLVFYHFQYVKALAEGHYDIGWYIISDEIKKQLYHSYLIKIEEIEKELVRLNNNYRRVFSVLKSPGLKGFMKNILKKGFGYNIIKIR